MDGDSASAAHGDGAQRYEVTRGGIGNRGDGGGEGVPSDAPMGESPLPVPTECTRDRFERFKAIARALEKYPRHGLTSTGEPPLVETVSALDAFADWLGRATPEELPIWGVAYRTGWALVAADAILDWLHYRGAHDLAQTVDERCESLVGASDTFDTWCDKLYVVPSADGLGHHLQRRDLTQDEWELYESGCAQVAGLAQSLARLLERAIAWVPPAPVKRGATVRVTKEEAKARAEAHCARNPFPGVRALAKLVGCSASTMSEAIDRSDPLRAMAAERAARRVSVSDLAMPEGAVASTAQTCEPDPAEAASTEERFRQLLDQAEPEERTNLLAMDREARRALVALVAYDPEAHELDESPRVRGHGRSGGERGSKEGL